MKVQLVLLTFLSWSGEAVNQIITYVYLDWIAIESKTLENWEINAIE